MIASGAGTTATAAVEARDLALSRSHPHSFDPLLSAQRRPGDRLDLDFLGPLAEAPALRTVQQPARPAQPRCAKDRAVMGVTLTATATGSGVSK